MTFESFELESIQFLTRLKNGFGKMANTGGLVVLESLSTLAVSQYLQLCG